MAIHYLISRSPQKETTKQLWQLPQGIVTHPHLWSHRLIAKTCSCSVRFSVQSSKVFSKKPPKKKNSHQKVRPKTPRFSPRKSKQTKTEKQSFDLLSASRDFLIYPPLSSGELRCSDAWCHSVKSTEKSRPLKWVLLTSPKFISRKHGILVIQCHLIQTHPPSYITLYSISICTVGSGYPKTTWFSE